MSALQALYSKVHIFNHSTSASSEFDGFLDYEITLSKSSKSKTEILDEFAIGIRLFP